MSISILFTPRLKFPIHIIYIVLVVAAIGLSVPRLFMKNQPRTRGNTIALAMGAKSLIIVAYGLLTEHCGALRRWQSYKAYWILNALEVVFWGAVATIIMQANFTRCVGVGCKMSWAVVAVSIGINALAFHLTIVCFLQYRMDARGSQDKPRLESMESAQEDVPLHHIGKVSHDH